jgi:uncharacterized sporulation protein YeaH/YhbH (DUF444 family)
MSDSVKNISTSSIQNAIDVKKQRQSDDSRNEIKGIQIAREASGDNPQTTNISTSVDTSKAGINQEIEKAEKALETNLPATNINKTDEKQKKETEETNKEIEAKNLNIIASWSSLGGVKRELVKDVW